MSAAANVLLAELKDLGLVEGVETTISETKTTVRAGDRSFESTAPGDAGLEEALTGLRDELIPLPAEQRPKAWEATTRTTAGPEEPGVQRSERNLGREDFA